MRVAGGAGAGEMVAGLECSPSGRWRLGNVVVGDCELGVRRDGVEGAES